MALNIFYSNLLSLPYLMYFRTINKVDESIICSYLVIINITIYYIVDFNNCNLMNFWS